MKKIIYCCVALLFCIKVQAQNVTITPDGITPVSTYPRISYDAILALPSPQAGDLAYDTTFQCLRIYSGGKWLCSYQNPVNYTPNLTAFASIGTETSNETDGDIAVDALGNIYVTGNYSGTITFGATTFTSYHDVFIAKYNKSGVLLWVQSTEGPAMMYGSAIAVDAGGNVFITGNFLGTAEFGTTSITSKENSYDVFLAKYNTNGVFQWVQSGGGALFDSGTGIAVDGSSNVYVTGIYDKSATFGTISVTAQNFDTDVFVAKCNSSGVFQWVQSGGGLGDDYGGGIAVDGSGNVYATGGYKGAGTFATTQVPYRGGLGTDIFLVKYNNTGTFQWVQTAGANFYEMGRDVAVDSNGSVYITGNYNDTITFGGSSVTSNGEGSALFLAKFDGNGNPIWLKSAGGTNRELGQGIAMDSTGIYITGIYSSQVTFGSKTISSNGYNNDIWVLKYNKSTGDFIWVQTAGGAETDAGAGIAVDANGNVYAVGTYMSTAQFGNTTKTTQVDSNIFVIRIDK